MFAKIISILCIVFTTTGIAQAAAPGGDPVVPPTNNQPIGRDAIALRVVPNPEHYSPLAWYAVNIKVKGAPQSLIVDGYEAVRDGRTVYVNAAKVATVNRCSNDPSIICTSSRQCPVTREPSESMLWPHFFIPQVLAATGECIPSLQRELYTNIYIISYNQNPENATTDIFGQILQNWKFNADVKNCSNDPNRICTQDNECRGYCQSTGQCSKTTDKACLLDNDCPQGETCRNKKSAIIHDVRRLADLRSIKDQLENYNTLRGTYPTLAQGTYLTNRTISTWPSWQATFNNALGGGLPLDPVNQLGACGDDRFSPATCWDELKKEYAGANNPLALPGASFAYYYQYKPNDNTFKFCSITESGFIQGKAIGTPVCQVNNCASCTNRQCGTDGCGHACGTGCRSGQVCQNFRCVNDAQQNQQDM